MRDQDQTHIAAPFPTTMSRDIEQVPYLSNPGPCRFSNNHHGGDIKPVVENFRERLHLFGRMSKQMTDGAAWQNQAGFSQMLYDGMLQQALASPVQVTTNGYTNGNAYPNPLSADSTYTDLSNPSESPYTNGHPSPGSYHSEYPQSSYLPPDDHAQQQPIPAPFQLAPPMAPLPDLGPSLQDVLGDTASAGLSGLSLEEGQNPGLSGSDAWLGQQHQQHLYYQYQQNNGTMNGYGGGSMDSSSGSSGMNDATNHNNDFPGTLAVSHGVSSDTTHKVVILEEPMEFGYRFRYEVEGKAHGGLQGKSSRNSNKRGSKIYPEIQINDVPNDVDEIQLEARLVSATEDYFPHPNKCSGKHCNNRGVFRHKLKRNEYPDFRFLLNNLTILQIKKQDQTKSLLDQLTDLADQDKLMEGKQRTSTELQRKADELSKIKHNGVVRIRFQASFLDPTEQKWKVAVAHSTPVHDQKQSNAAELRICRVSTISSPCNGGGEIYLLCEKVSKDDIKVKFRDDKGWEADGKFQGTDVHYQFAIVFRVPPYKDLDIQKEVQVDMVLYRPSTSTSSKAIKFTYYPVRSEQEHVTRKRRRTEPPNNMDGYLPYGGGPGGYHGSYGSPGSDGSGGGGYNFPPSQGYSDPTYGYSRKISAAHSSGAPQDKEGNEKAEPMDLSVSANKDGDLLPVTIEDVEGDSAPPAAVKPEAAPTDVKTEPESPKSEKAASPAQKTEVKPEKDAEKEADDDDLEVDGVCMQLDDVLPMETRVIKAPLADLRSKPTPAVRTNTLKNSEQKLVKNLQTELEDMTRRLSEEQKINMSLKDRLYDSNRLIVQTLMNYAQTGNSQYFLAQFRYHLAFSDDNGDNSLHMAVIHNQAEVLKSMLNICKATNTMAAIHQLNAKRQTPLHIATIMCSPDMVDALLHHNANPLAADMRGDNCFHMAAEQGDFRTMELLCHWLRVAHKDTRVLDSTNHAGYTPLHKAVQRKQFNCVQALVSAGADADIGDGTSGRTALHHAVLNEDIVNVSELLLNGKADVNAQAYDGNTALHLAVEIRNPHITKLLVRSGADPDIENYEPNYRDEDETEQIGNSVYDLCDMHSEILESIETSLNIDKGQEAQISADSIRNLSIPQRRSLAAALDKGDWKRLVKALSYSSLMGLLQSKHSPTDSLLKYLESEKSASISNLKSKLVEIGRDDCINLIGTQVSAQTRLPQREPEDAILRSGLRNPLQINKGTNDSGIDSGLASGMISGMTSGIVSESES